MGHARDRGSDRAFCLVDGAWAFAARPPTLRRRRTTSLKLNDQAEGPAVGHRYGWIVVLPPTVLPVTSTVAPSGVVPVLPVTVKEPETTFPSNSTPP